MNATIPLGWVVCFSLLAFIGGLFTGIRGARQLPHIKE